jgi:hypothetical protein
MSSKRFKCAVESGERGRVFITVPFDPGAEWGARARHHVKGTINGHAFEGSLGSRGGSFFMPLNKELRAEAGVEPGDQVAVVMEPSAAKEEGLPEDIAGALASSVQAAAFFEGLTAFYRNTYIKWIESAKKADTRAARVAEMIGLLEAGKKQR